jgi:hypothetical protein
MFEGQLLLLTAVAFGSAIVGFSLAWWWIKTKYVVLCHGTHVAFLTALNQRTRELDQLRCWVDRDKYRSCLTRKSASADAVPRLRLVRCEDELVRGCPTTGSSLGY